MFAGDDERWRQFFEVLQDGAKARHSEAGGGIGERLNRRSVRPAIPVCRRCRARQLVQHEADGDFEERGHGGYR